MAWMMLIMGLPIWGLVLFFVYPWQSALVPYLILVGSSAFFDTLMMRAMRLPVRSGSEELIGSTATVLSWEHDAGWVVREGEIWQARGKGPFVKGDSVVIEDLSGLVLSVKSVPGP